MIRKSALTLLMVALTVVMPVRAYDMITVVNLSRDLAIASVAMARGVPTWPAPYGSLQPAAQSLAEDAQRFYESIKDGASNEHLRNEYKRVMSKFSRFDTAFQPVHQQVNDPNAGSAFHTVRYHYCALRGMIWPAMKPSAGDYDECRGS